MSRTTEQERRDGFVTCSAGNHGQAVAWCAKKLGARCVVYVPEDANERKVRSIESMGATIVRRPHHEIMESMTDDRMSRVGMTFIHPFGDTYIVAGQGTIGLEILEDLPGVRDVIVPIGGGGLFNGIAIAIRAKRPDVKVYGVEAEGAAPLPKSLVSGRAESVGDPKTIADGIAASMTFEYMLPLFKENLAGLFTVSDQEMKDAVKHIMKECHAIAEPAGASSLAAAIKHRGELSEPTVCVISGGNAPQALLAELLTEG